MAYEYHHRRMVQFIDTDMSGIIHYVNYFRYLEEAEMAFVGSLGLKDLPAMPRVSLTAEFLRPVTFRDMLDIHLWVAAKGRSSIEYAGSFTCGEKEVARARLKVVCIDRDAAGGMRSRAIPPDLNQMIEVAPFAVEGNSSEPL